MNMSCRYGSHRADGGLPQPASRLDATMQVLPTEALLSVSLLNLDATSMKQIAADVGGNPERIAKRILEIVKTRGKMHNPVTNSGGVLVGKVTEIGDEFERSGLKVGDIICPIVSLSLLPLELFSIQSVKPDVHQVEVDGRAIIFSSTAYGMIPDDMPLPMAVGLIDIAGAPARVLRMITPGMSVAVLGAGMAGVMSVAAARQRLGSSGRLVIMDVSGAACEAVRKLGLADECVAWDLRDPIGSCAAAIQAGGSLFDVVINVTSAPGTEGAAILMCNDGGRVLFFGMATNFQTAALTAEGAGKDIELLIGNGYLPGCVEDTLSLARSKPELLKWLAARFS